MAYCTDDFLLSLKYTVRKEYYLIDFISVATDFYNLLVSALWCSAIVVVVLSQMHLLEKLNLLPLNNMAIWTKSVVLKQLEIKTHTAVSLILQL